MGYAVAGSYLDRWRAPDFAGPAAAPRGRRRDLGFDHEAKPRKAGGLLEAVRTLLAAARA